MKRKMEGQLRKQIGGRDKVWVAKPGERKQLRAAGAQRAPEGGGRQAGGRGGLSWRNTTQRVRWSFTQGLAASRPDGCSAEKQPRPRCIFYSIYFPPPGCLPVPPPPFPNPASRRTPTRAPRLSILRPTWPLTRAARLPAFSATLRTQLRLVLLAIAAMFARLLRRGPASQGSHDHIASPHPQ